MLYSQIHKNTQYLWNSSTTAHLFCFVDSNPLHPPLHIYIVQSNQPQLQVSVKKGDILFCSREMRALQFQRSCYLPSISVSSLNQNIIPQKPFTYVGHYPLFHTSLCFTNLYNQILLQQILTRCLDAVTVHCVSQSVPKNVHE